MVSGTFKLQSAYKAPGHFVKNADSDSAGLGQGLRVCIPARSQVVPMLPAPRPHTRSSAGLGGRPLEPGACWVTIHRPQRPQLNRGGWAGSCLAPSSSSSMRCLQVGVPGGVDGAAWLSQAENPS